MARTKKVDRADRERFEDFFFDQNVAGQRELLAVINMLHRLKLRQMDEADEAPEQRTNAADAPGAVGA